MRRKVKPKGSVPLKFFMANGKKPSTHIRRVRGRFTFPHYFDLWPDKGGVSVQKPVDR